MQVRRQIRWGGTIFSCGFNLCARVQRRISLMTFRVRRSASPNLKMNAVTDRNWIRVKASNYPETYNKYLRKLARWAYCIY
jgi:hypothetical protein